MNCTGYQGSWPSSSLEACAALCEGCPRCRYISFTAVEGECSWFHNCPAIRTGAHLPGYSAAHTTYQVRGDNYQMRKDQYALSGLRPMEMDEYRIFAVSSLYFWRRHRQVVVGFFNSIAAIGGGPGMLVARSTHVCDEAEKLGVRCFIPYGCSLGSSMLSREKWHVVKHYLAHGRPVICAGVDVRLLQPVANLFSAFNATGAGNAVDAAFDGRARFFDDQGPGGHVLHFTPDMIVAFPTSKMRRFVDRILGELKASAWSPHTRLAGVSAEDVDGPEMLQQLRERVLDGLELTGPADQDLLQDALMSELYGRRLWVRKQYDARMKLRLAPLAARGVDGNKPYKMDMPALPMVRGVYGTLVKSPMLNVLLTDGRGVWDGYGANGLPCSRCSDWDTRTTMAVHCLAKESACLDLSNCSCLDEGLRARLRRTNMELPWAGRSVHAGLAWKTQGVQSASGRQKSTPAASRSRDPTFKTRAAKSINQKAGRLTPVRPMSPHSGLDR